MIAVVRHGERADDMQANYMGPPFKIQFDTPLTAKGKQQSFKSGQVLKYSLVKPIQKKEEEQKESISKIPQVNTIHIISSPLLRCLQTAAYIAKGLGELKTTITVDWKLAEYNSAYFYTSWKKEGSPLNGVTLCVQNEKELLQNELDGLVGKLHLLSKESQPKFPESLGQCQSRYRERFIELMSSQFQKEEDKTKLIILVSHGFAIQQFMKIFHPLMSYDTVDYCSISIGVKKSSSGDECVTQEGSYKGWELKLSSDSSHVGLCKSSLIELI